jgi:hypothetical protein
MKMHGRDFATGTTPPATWRGRIIEDRDWVVIEALIVLGIIVAIVVWAYGSGKRAGNGLGRESWPGYPPASKAPQGLVLASAFPA